MQARSSLPRAHCSECHKAIDVHQQARGCICDDAACRAGAAKAALRKKNAEAQAALDAVARDHLPALLADSGLRAADVVLLALPGTDTALRAPDQERRERFRDHIIATLQQGKASESPSLEDPPAIAAQACATCRGMCCRMGGDTAYVQAGAIDRIREHYPELDDAGIVDFLMQSIPERTIAGSCILSGADGCALPRDLRSHVCNNFHCQPLWKWSREAAVSGPKPTAIVVADGDKVVRASLWRD